MFSLSIYSYIKNPINNSEEEPIPTINDPKIIPTPETSNPDEITKDNETEENTNPSNSGDSSNQEPQNLIDPADYECGYYFQEYQICAGSCPEGECISEGRSCYCKN